MKQGHQYLIITGALLLSPMAQAHDASIGAGFVAGFMHPLTGLDHLLALLLAGVLIGRLIVRKGVAIGALVIALGFGAGGALLLGAQAWMEAAVILSLPVFLVLHWTTRSIMANVAITIIGLFMIAHGWAHGVELIGMNSIFILAFLLSSATVLSISCLIAMKLKTNLTSGQHAGA